jgi:eukaryotic-like serine/threonine-protein kinase
MITDDLARRIAQDFDGKTVSGCLVEGYHSHGASSVVLRGRDEAGRVAIKIYGKHLINEADEAQAAAELERIRRQVELGKTPHPNIVQTRRAGQCPESGYHYLIMDFVDDKTLEELLSDIPRDRIRAIIQEIAKATLYLQQTRGHVHRDIKPANVAVNLDTFKVTLLDLGLIRPVDGETATDQAPRFLGTKRYCPPEFVNQTMNKDEIGWDAVSFYQLGAVLYALIMRKPLFDNYQGDELRHAIESEVPQIEAHGVPADLIQLTLDCLQKEPTVRGALVNWGRFLSVPDPNAGQNELDRLRNAVRRIAPPDLRDRYPDGARAAHALETAYKRLELAVDYHVRSLLNSNDTLFPRHTVTLSKLMPTSFRLQAVITYPRSAAALDITVFLTCELIDVASRLCRCDLSVCAGALEALPDAVPRVPLFYGTFVAETFSTALDNVLLGEVARALNGQCVDPLEEDTRATANRGEL